MATVQNALRDLVASAARAIHRSAEDAEPYAQILADNWFDSPESLARCKAEELTALNIPLRFAQQICDIAGGAKASTAPARSTYGDRARGKGEGKMPPMPAVLARELERDAKRLGRWNGPKNTVDKQGRSTYTPGSKVRSLKVKDMLPEFRQRGAILGKQGRNLRHIEEKTGVKVDLKGEVGDEANPMELIFKDAPSPGAMEEAVNIGRDLLHSVYKDYHEWREECLQRDRQERDRAFAAGQSDWAGKGKGGKGGKGKGAPGYLPDHAKPGDWACGACGDHQFARNDVCRSCGAPRPAADAAAPSGSKGEGKSRRKYDDKLAGMAFQHTIDIIELDEHFHIRGKILGKSGSLVRDIEAKTGALLQLQGEPSALRLEIGAATQEELTAAVEAAEQLVGQVYVDYDTWLANGGADAEANAEGGRKRSAAELPGGGEFTETLELQECEPKFALRAKVLGFRGQNIRQIEQDYGCAVALHGRNKDLKLEISAGSADALDSAVRQAHELITTIYEEYATWLTNPTAGEAANDDLAEAGADASGKGGGKGDLRKILKLKDTHPEFNLRNALRGDKTQNLHHIQDQTKASVWIFANPGEPVRVEVVAKTQASFDKAVQMTKDLIKTVFKDYQHWLESRERGGHGGHSGGHSGGKGAGAGKGHGGKAGKGDHWAGKGDHQWTGKRQRTY